MAAQTMFSFGTFSLGALLVDEGQPLNDIPRSAPAAPQLVMLANVAAVSAPEVIDGAVADEKEMMELKTVGCSYSDSEDEGIITYSYDSQSRQEVCIVDYPESPPSAEQTASEQTAADQVDKQGDESEDPPHPAETLPSISNNARRRGAKRRDAPPAMVDGAQKKKPLYCKPCQFQAQSEKDFMEHLSSHIANKMMVVNQVEGRNKTKEAEAPTGKEAEPHPEGAASTGDIKGLIKCERCGYNTNRYDHYISHLKHHSKEGEDHRVFKCTLCAYSTISQYHWRKHLRNHFPSKLHTCSQCSYFSDRKSNYVQHIRTHTGVRPFRCPYCDYSSSQKTHLTRHMRTHSGERPFKCESCSYLAANQHEVTRHARQVHNGPKPLSCLYCEYKTADRSNFKKHVELHLKPRQFLCPLCKYAASKKCNLQYHIKSRHSGCSVDLDVSKVKLRVKKPGPDGADDKPHSRAGKSGNSSSVEEDTDVEEDVGEDAPSLMSLSVKKNTEQRETPRKTNMAANKERAPKEAEKKLTARQKRAKEAPSWSPAAEEPPAESTDTKAKRRVKKAAGGKTAPPRKTNQPKSPKNSTETERPEPALKANPTPELKVKPENENKAKHRKPGMKRSEAAEAKGSDKTHKGKVGRDKPTKRRAAEALDLSQKVSKNKRLKGAEILPPKEPSGHTDKLTEPSPTGESSKAGLKQNKTRTQSKNATGLRPARAPKTAPSGSTSEAQKVFVSESSPAQESSAQSNTGSSPALESSVQPEPGPAQIKPESAQSKSSLLEESPPPEPEGPDPTSSASAEKTQDPEPEARPDPTFLKPSPPPLLLPAQRGRNPEHEDDEGVHSSHEGGSDISDSASEGSDDSGLNGTASAAQGKTPSDPETPTDEIPTPTELKSHMCIFCDRMFPLGAQYRRHLNRHLVNLYYLDGKAPR